MTDVLLGRLPREEGKSAIAVLPGLGAAPTRPVEVHNLELDAADTNMYGNGGTEVLGVPWGDCVHEMIEEARVVAAKALGVPVTHITPTQVVRNYCDQNGIPFVASAAPGPGSNILNALKWAQAHPERFNGDELLFYGDVPINDESMKQAVAEFGSICVGVTVYEAMEYPARVWYNEPLGRIVGGHGIAGGSYTAAANFIKTWGYMVTVNAAGFGTIDELVVCVWKSAWRGLTYDRQLACIASYVWATGKPWTGPAPIVPPQPPTPNPEADVQTLSRFATIFDGPLVAGKAVTLNVAGAFGLPATTTGIVAIVRAVRPLADGWCYVGPNPTPLVFGPARSAGGAPSTLDFNAGRLDDVTVVCSLTGGTLWLYSTVALTRLVIDVTAIMGAASASITGTVGPDASITFDKEI